jgi:Neuraminidase (sialidase)
MSQLQHARIIDTKVICKQPGKYIGWPTVGKMPNGELLAVFSGDRDAHVCPFGKSFLVRSADNGDTWGEAELINDTPLDDRDTGLCICQDGTVIMSWFTSHYEDNAYLRTSGAVNNEARWQQQITAVTPDDIRQWAEERCEDGRYALGHWIRRSTDAGHTWEAPVRVPPTTPHGPIELSDGRLMFVGIETNHGRREREGNIIAAESRDQGRTWSVIGRITMFPSYPGDDPQGYAYLCEPHLVEVAPGKLLGMARYEEMPRPKPAWTRNTLWQFTSDDGGYTWTEPR